MGSFSRPRSDVDLLVVTEGPLPETIRRHLGVDLVALFDQSPIIRPNAWDHRIELAV